MPNGMFDSFTLDWSGWVGFSTDASGAQTARFRGGRGGFTPTDIPDGSVIECYDFWAFTPDGELGYMVLGNAVPILFPDETVVPNLTLD